MAEGQKEGRKSKISSENESLIIFFNLLFTKV